MRVRHGANHDQAARDAVPIPRFARAVAPTVIPNWFLRFPADGDALRNDELGNCVAAARCQMIRLWGGKADASLSEALYTEWGGYDPRTGQPDNGLDPLQVMFASCAAPGVDAAGKPWPILWTKADPANTAEIRAALEVYPLELTLGLPAAIADYPERWRDPPALGMKPDLGHRVVLGNETAEGWIVRSWGLDWVVHPDLMRVMLLAVDVPIPTSAPNLMRTGIDYAAFAAAQPKR